MAEKGDVDGKLLARVEDCAQCHQSIADQWEGSAHAFASMSNPIYRASFEEIRSSRGARASRMCAGCHDPALLVDRLIDVEDPHGIDPLDPRAHAGVTCRTCHGSKSATRQGNGSYSLRNLPALGGEVYDALARGEKDAVAAHRSEVALPPTQASALCASCHRSFLHKGTGNAHFLPGADDVLDWSTSAWAGIQSQRYDPTVTPQSCVQCHMRQERAPEDAAASDDGHVASHRFFGGHSWLASLQKNRELEEAVRNFMSQSIQLDAYLHRGGLRNHQSHSGKLLYIDVVVFNASVGHRFPGGTRDIQDSWLRLRLRDGSGKTLASAGATRADAHGRHHFRTWLIDGEGTVEGAHRTRHFAFVGADHTIAPRDARVVRYLVPPELVSDGTLPQETYLDIELRHRSRTLAMQNLACVGEKTHRGRRFSRAASKYRRNGLTRSSCAPQPVFTLAQRTLYFGEAKDPVVAGRLTKGNMDIAPWLRWYRYGLGLMHAPGDYLSKAEACFRRALDTLLPNPNSPSIPGFGYLQVQTALAKVYARQNRGDDLALLEREVRLHRELDVPIAFRLAAAELQASRWNFASSFEMTRSMRGDTSPLSGGADLFLLGLRAAAIASTSEAAVEIRSEAYRDTQQALHFYPTDSTFLRLQSQLLQRRQLLQDRSPQAFHQKQANRAALRYRQPEGAQEARRLWARKNPLYALEREELHVHPMILTP